MPTVRREKERERKGIEKSKPNIKTERAREADSAAQKNSTSSFPPLSLPQNPPSRRNQTKPTKKTEPHAVSAAAAGPDYSWTSSTKRSLALELVRVTEAAALAGARHLGRGDKNAADGAAVDIMRRVLNTIPMDGVIVIGEGM